MAIHDFVRAYTRDKNKAIHIYSRFVRLLEESFGVHIEIEFPPVFNSPFDRQMYIIKNLHDNKYNAAAIADRLWLSEKTIGDDIGHLQDGISVLVQKLQIMRKNINGRSGLTNTIHPLFLTPNLIQGVVLLQGLQRMAADKVYREYTLMLSANIWSELYEYARSRVINISSQLGLDVKWFTALEARRCTSQDKGMNKSIYATEVECFNDEGPGNVLDFLKNRKPCTIEVQGKEGCKILENCLVTGLAENGTVAILHNGESLFYPIKAIRASRYGKCVY